MAESILNLVQLILKGYECLKVSQQDRKITKVNIKVTGLYHGVLGGLFKKVFPKINEKKMLLFLLE